MTQSRGRFMLILLVLLLHQMNCVYYPNIMFIHISYSSDIAIEWCFLLVLLYLAKKLQIFLVLRIPKRRKNIQYVMKRTCNQLVHSAYEMAPTINFDWLTTPSFVARIFTPRYIVCTSTWYIVTPYHVRIYLSPRFITYKSLPLFY